jgi:hypothetical protein
MKNKYAKDEINFFMFPLFLQTKNYGVTNNNFLWPFIGVYSGNGVEGGRLWPLYGYKKRGALLTRGLLSGRYTCKGIENFTAPV